MGWLRPQAGRSPRGFRVAGAVLVGVALAAITAYVALPLLYSGAVHALDLALSTCVWLMTSLDSDAGVWTVASVVGRAAASALITPRVLAIGGGLVVVSGLSLYGLQRLLDSEEEPR